MTPTTSSLARLGVLLSTTSLAVLCASGNAAALESTPPQAASILTAHAAVAPGGKVRGATIVYPDGAVFVAVPASVSSISQCASLRFCIWTSSNFSGSFTEVGGTSVTKALSGTVGSVYNNRSNAARLYNNSGTSWACYAPGAQNSAVSSAYSSSPKVYLSGSTSC